jgi:hypothetical protein
VHTKSRDEVTELKRIRNSNRNFDIVAKYLLHDMVCDAAGTLRSSIRVVELTYRNLGQDSPDSRSK